MNLAHPDNFSGVSESDIEKLRAMQQKTADLPGLNGCITNWFGLLTQGSNHPYIDVPAGGLILSDLPVPDDGVHAHTIEYVGLHAGLFRRSGDATDKNRPLVCVELGASYGTWSVPFVFLANKFFPGRQIRIITVEPTTGAYDKISSHLELNGLSDLSNLEWTHFDGVVASRKRSFFFPDVDSSFDNGGAPSPSRVTVDYRGKTVAQKRVQGFKIREILQGSEIVDFLHADIQGSELQLMRDRNFISEVTRKVSVLFLGTHSREIEGVAAVSLIRAGWQLLNERPARFSPNRHQDPAGWTTVDGGQLWLNPRLD